MELAHLGYVVRHFPVNVVNTLIHNFELSADIFKVFHFPNWAWNSRLTAFPFQPLLPSRPCWSYGSCWSRRSRKPLLSFFTFGGFQIQVPPFRP